jgi:hypothetical protein
VRIFDYWAIVWGCVLKITESDANFWTTFFHGINHALILASDWLSDLGDFFTNASGHPAASQSIEMNKVKKIHSPKRLLKSLSSPLAGLPDVS